MRHELSGNVGCIVESWLMRVLNLSLQHLSHRVHCGTKDPMPHVCVCLSDLFPTGDVSRRQLIRVESSFAGRGTKSLSPFLRSCTAVARTRNHMVKNASVSSFLWRICPLEIKTTSITIVVEHFNHWTAWKLCFCLFRFAVFCICHMSVFIF